MDMEVSFHTRENFRERVGVQRKSGAGSVGSMSMVSRPLRIWKRKMVGLVVEAMAVVVGGVVIWVGGRGWR